MDAAIFSLLGVILAVVLFVAREIIALHTGLADLRVKVVDRLDRHLREHHTPSA